MVKYNIKCAWPVLQKYRFIARNSPTKTTLFFYNQVRYQKGGGDKPKAHHCKANYVS